MRERYLYGPFLEREGVIGSVWLWGQVSLCLIAWVSESDRGEVNYWPSLNSTFALLQFFLSLLTTTRQISLKKIKK